MFDGVVKGITDIGIRRDIILPRQGAPYGGMYLPLEPKAVIKHH